MFKKYFRKYTYNKSSSRIDTVLDTFCVHFSYDVGVVREEIP